MKRGKLARRDPATTPVAGVMTCAVVCVEPSTPARQAMAVMTERRCRHLPVVQDGRVVSRAERRRQEKEARSKKPRPS